MVVIVVGVFVILVVLIVVGFIIGYFCWKVKCKKEKVEFRKGFLLISIGMLLFFFYYMDSGKL